jgi:hypothetical protein
MNIGNFFSHNKQIETITFQTNASSGTTFNPSAFLSQNTSLWNTGDNGFVVAGNTLSKVYGDSGTTKTVKLIVPDLSKVYSFQAYTDNLVGNLDLSSLTNSMDGSNMWYQNNLSLTGFTQPSQQITALQFLINDCDITGVLDISNIELQNQGATSATFNCSNNNSLTGVLHKQSTGNISTYRANNCNITGNLVLTAFTGLRGVFLVNDNTPLTGITHTACTGTFTSYSVYNCNLTGNLDLSMMTNLGGSFSVYNNPLLTGITHTASPQTFTNYNVSDCGLIGNLNVPFSGIGTTLEFQNNALLTGLTISASTNNIRTFNVRNCDLQGTLDLSIFPNLGGNSGQTTSIDINNNPNLSGVNFPTSTKYFLNTAILEAGAIIRFQDCDLNYVDFKPLSGATFLSGVTNGSPRILLRNNSMTAAEVNQILVDFSGNATYNPTGWSKLLLDIGGTNADPDTSSGGYDGLAAISFLTGSPYNWTITY